MKKNPKVSIIIPVYNGSDYVREAIDSALAQTYKNIEIVVINDGSKDNTEDIILSYGEKVKYYKKENGGVATALNKALEVMTGDYFSWLSHDDLYEKTKIEKQINELSKCDENTILLSDYRVIDEKGEKIADVRLKHDLIEEHHEKALFNGMVNGITLLIPKKAFDECGLFDVKLWCTQDYDMWYRMLLKGYRFRHINEVLSMSRQHSNQTTNTSPVVINEGNDLWIRMMKTLPMKIKENMSKNEYVFFEEMFDFLKVTPYKRATQYALEKTDLIKKEMHKKIDKIKVSIIIPFYNNDVKELNRALDSVLNQTHKNIEIVLINDGSSKKYTKFMEKIKKINFIKYINIPKNQGPANARNEGFKNITGEYVAFLDADDEFLENKISEQLIEMKLKEADISHTSYYLNKDNERVEIDSGKQSGDVIKQAICSCRIATPTVMIKVKYLKKKRLMFNTDMRIGEDICFWLSILKNTMLLGIDKPFTVVNGSSSSSAYNDKKQAIGLKNILTFVLNDKELREYDFEVSILANNYYDAISLKFSYDVVPPVPNYYDEYQHYYDKYQQVINSKYWKLTVPFRFAGRCIENIKKKGIAHFIKRVKIRIQRKIVTKK